MAKPRGYTSKPLRGKITFEPILSIIFDRTSKLKRRNKFADMTKSVGGDPKPIAYYQTEPPWVLFISVFETNKQLSVVL